MGDNRNTDLVSKIVPKVLGNPKLVTTLPEGQDKHVLGVLVGQARGTGVRTAPTGDAYEYLKGDFKAIPADPTKNAARSGILYLPGGIFETIAEQLLDNEGNQTGAVVQFAFEVATMKATNPQGYSWAFTPLLAASESDPLAGLEKLASEKRAAIEGPKPAKGKAA